MLADGAPYYPVEVVVGCVTRGAAGREKEALAGGGGGRTGFFGEEKREGRRIGKWEGSERLEASKWSSILRPKATLEDHIALEMEPSGLNASRTSHSECHTLRAPLNGFPCIMCIPLNSTNTWGGKPQCTHGPIESNGGDLTSPVRTYGSSVGARPNPCYTDRALGTQTPRAWTNVDCLSCGEGKHRLKTMIHQGGLEQGLNASGSRGVGTNAARNNHKEQPTSQKKCQIDRAQNFYTPLLLNCQKGQHLPAPEVYKNQSPSYSCVSELLCLYTVGVLFLTSGALLNTIGASLLTLGKCVSSAPQWTISKETQL